jgi:hypothetical protein
MQRIVLLLIFVVVALTADSVSGDEPAKKPDGAFPPPPQQVIPEAPPLQMIPPHFIVPERPRPETREAWRYYGVDSLGRFRPRVIMAPYGSYYYYNGEPYPWTGNRSTHFMPYAVD